MELIDLTRTLDPADRELLPPEGLKALASVVAPSVTYSHPAGAGRDEFAAALQCGVHDLPDGEGWGSEMLSEFNSHLAHTSTRRCTTDQPRRVSLLARSQTSRWMNCSARQWCSTCAAGARRISRSRWTR